MTSAEFTHTLTYLGLRTADFARETGLSAGHVSRMRTGKVEVPKLVEEYLRLRIMVAGEQHPGISLDELWQ